MSFAAPDWRNESGYPSHWEHESLSFWAWQFLRRNKEYQAEWNAYAEGLREMAKRVPKLLPLVRMICEDEFHQSAGETDGPGTQQEQFIELESLAEDQLEYSHMTPPALPSEQTVEQYEKRMSREGCKRWSWTYRDAFLGKKWGIERLAHPGRERIAIPNGFLTNGASIRFLGNDNPYAKDKNYLVPVLDMRLPVTVLRAQFEMCLRRRESRIKAGKLTPYTGRPERNLHLYREYLRVLDADAVGVGIAAIAKVLLPTHEQTGAQKTVRNWLKAAKKIREKDYLLLPAYSEIKIKKR